MNPFIIREPDAREREWIVNQWVHEISFRGPRGKHVQSFSGVRKDNRWEYGDTYWGSPCVAKLLIVPDLYKEAMTLLVRKLVDEAELRVACMTAVPDEPIGWIAFEPGGVLHFVRVLGQARRLGVATALLDAAALTQAMLTATFMTQEGELLLASLRPEIVIEVPTAVEAVEGAA